MYLTGHHLLRSTSKPKKYRENNWCVESKLNNWTANSNIFTCSTDNQLIRGLIFWANHSTESLNVRIIKIQQNCKNVKAFFFFKKKKRIWISVTFPLEWDNFFPSQFWRSRPCKCVNFSTLYRRRKVSRFLRLQIFLVFQANFLPFYDLFLRSRRTRSVRLREKGSFTLGRINKVVFPKLQSGCHFHLNFGIRLQLPVEIIEKSANFSST